MKFLNKAFPSYLWPLASLSSLLNISEALFDVFKSREKKKLTISSPPPPVSDWKQKLKPEPKWTRDYRTQLFLSKTYKLDSIMIRILTENVTSSPWNGLKISSCKRNRMLKVWNKTNINILYYILYYIICTICIMYYMYVYVLYV